VGAAIASTDAAALPDCARACGEQLNEVVELVRGELTPLNRATLSALVVMDVHARDVAAALAAEEGVAGQPGAFSWTSQLRQYWEPAAGQRLAAGAAAAGLGWFQVGGSKGGDVLA
jgi:dynein heavy chain